MALLPCESGSRGGSELRERIRTGPSARPLPLGSIDSWSRDLRELGRAQFAGRSRTYSGHPDIRRIATIKDGDRRASAPVRASACCGASCGSLRPLPGPRRARFSPPGPTPGSDRHRPRCPSFVSGPPRRCRCRVFPASFIQTLSVVLPGREPTLP